jgi:non-specific serine/threonine protein kinase
LALLLLGIVAEDRADFEVARPYLEEAAALYQADGETAWFALAGPFHLGVVTQGEGDYAGAQALLEDALVLFREAGNQWGVGISLFTLGFLACHRGELQEAATRYAECLAMMPDVRSVETTMECLSGVATLAAEAQPERAARLFGVAAALAEPLGYTPPLPEQIAYERAKQVARASLGDARFAAAYQAVRDVTLERAIAEGNAALVLLWPYLQAASQRAGGPTAGPALTSRELDVLRLIVEGHRDQEIADALFLSRRTVQTHVTHLFSKLGVNTRAEAAAVAVRHGLV